MIKFEKTGFDKLNEEEKKSFERIASEYSPKIERKIKNIGSIVIRLKEYHTSGKRRKYSLHAKVIISGSLIEAESSEWDFNAAVIYLFKKIIDQAEGMFRVSDQHRKKK